MDLTHRMIAYVQCLMMAASDGHPKLYGRLERIERYLIRRYNRD